MAGKKSPKSPNKVAVSSNLDVETAKKLAELKAEGNQSFARGDYNKAISIYDEAIKLVPGLEAASEKAEFYNNKAACFIGLKRYKEAVKECTSALELQPNSTKALQRRCKAYEAQGLYKQALTDAQAVNKTDAVSDETREVERRLKDMVNGKAAVAAANGGSRTAASRTPSMNQLTQRMYSVKCMLGDDAKMVHMNLASTYADLLAAVQQKFPGAGPVVLKYVDKSGDLVTISQQADLHFALQELAEVYSRQTQNQHGPKLSAFPPLKIIVTKVASENEMVPPPAEEILHREDILALQRQQAAKASRQDQEPPTQELQVDSWLIEFANLFREATNINPDAHVEPHNQGWEVLSKALDQTLNHEKAGPLFDKAIESFKEVTCTGLLNWANVYQLRGTKKMEEGAKAGANPKDVEETVLAEYDEAEKRFKEALGFKEDFFEGICALAQLEFERAKLKAGILVEPITPAKPEETEGKTTEQVQQEQQAAISTATAAAINKWVTAESVEAGRSHMEKAMEWSAKAIELAPKQDELKQQNIKEAAAKAEQETGQAQSVELYTYLSQAKIMQGNFLYEWSQVLGKTGSDWKNMLDQAAELYRSSGCAEKDIRQALKSHFMKDQLDLGPEPEEPKKEEAATAKPEAKAPVPEAKGLPSLEVKKKKVAEGNA